MYLIVTSKEDVASMNIREHLLSMADWKEEGVFDGSPVLVSGAFAMTLIEKIHLNFENLDAKFKEETGIGPEALLILFIYGFCLWRRRQSS